MTEDAAGINEQVVHGDRNTELDIAEEAIINSLQLIPKDSPTFEGIIDSLNMLSIDLLIERKKAGEQIDQSIEELEQRKRKLIDLSYARRTRPHEIGQQYRDGYDKLLDIFSGLQTTLPHKNNMSKFQMKKEAYRILERLIGKTQTATQPSTHTTQK